MIVKNSAADIFVELAGFILIIIHFHQNSQSYFHCYCHSSCFNYHTVDSRLIYLGHPWWEWWSPFIPVRGHQPWLTATFSGPSRLLPSKRHSGKDPGNGSNLIQGGAPSHFRWAKKRQIHNILKFFLKKLKKFSLCWAS